MVTTRLMELRKRRGLMIALIAVNIGLPIIFLTIRLISHAVAPKSYGPAGGYSIFTDLTTGVMYIFGFIVAAVVGCTAGSVDLTEGMFRHLVITGRSRLALYLARIPAGLAIVIAMVAIGYTIVCVVCTLAAPTQLNYDGANVPHGLSRPALESWAAAHADEVICDFFYSGPNPLPNVPNCPSNGPPPGATITTPKGTFTVPTYTEAQIRALAVTMANQNYADYSTNFLVPPTSLMIDVGLWIALEATIGFIVGLGLASLMGQRTVPVILLVLLELILTPLFSRHVISHFINFERAIAGVAMVHIEPGGLPSPFGGGGGGGGGPGGGGLGRNLLIPESTLVASLVIVGWILFWTAIGAWRMMTRDA